jgi:MiaB/RimO family radical SAM methylthiotransferase
VERAGAEAPGMSVTGARLLGRGPSVPVKLASGCDRRCTFCAIPMFRGAFVSRRPTDVLEEVRALAADGVREAVLVSENSTSYGKDLGDLRLLESLLPELASVPGIEWVRVSYLQPAEIRPGMLEVIGGTPGVARYFDLSFQHASGPVLRRMRRFGDSDSFLALLARIREIAPDAGVRSNFIVGFPGETREEFDELAGFLAAARLDAVGVFGYSDEDGTEAVGLPGHLPEDEVAERVAELASLADELMAQRVEERIGARSRVLVESVEGDAVEGRAEHQGPEDASTLVLGASAVVRVGDVLDVEFVRTDGVDLIGQVVA